MNEAWRGGVATVAITSLVPLVVMVPLAMREALLRRVLPSLVALAAGALLGAACFHLLPEAVARYPERPLFVALMTLAGAALFAIVERTMHRVATGRLADGARGGGPGGRRPLVPLLVAGDALHNLVDGVLVGASFLASPSLGVLTAVAVALHELPRELGTFGVFVHAGVPARRAIVYNLATGLVAVAGAAVALTIGTRAESFAASMLPFAAGTFLYLAAAIVRQPAGTRAASLVTAAVGASLVGVAALVR